MPFSSPGKAIAIYTPPSRERMQALVERHVHQPPVHKTVKLMGLRGWNNGINNVISAQAMREAGTGLACLDKGMADGGGFRIIRRFVRNTQGVFDDKVLRQHSPLLFDFLKTLMEHFSFENVAMHRMTAQDMHCDPHAKFAPADEMHILLTVNGADHCFALGSSEEIRNLDDRYRTWRCSSGKNGSAAVKLQENKIDDALLLPRACERPLQDVEQALLAGLDRDFEAQTNP